MNIQAITLFPEMFSSITQYGVTGRALAAGLWHFTVINPRQFANNRLGYVDDRPFGGGSGMVMSAEPLVAAIAHARASVSGSAHVVYLSPQGRPLTHQWVKTAATTHTDVILLCGRYEGVDERVLRDVDEEISVGDFVVSGGELPAMILMDAVLRWVPGVLGTPESAEEDSFAQGLLDWPHYTRPVEFEGMVVPEVLISGNHAAIAQWRLEQALRRTLARRPELLAQRDLIPQEACLLAKIQQEQQA